MGQKKLSEYTHVPANEITLADILIFINGGLNKRTTFNDFVTFFRSLEKPLSKIILVDPNGSDTLARRGSFDNPFATVEAAQAVASNEDWIVLLPGSHSTEANLAKIGMSINYFLYKDAILNLDHATDPACFDNDEITNVKIYGQGSIIQSSGTAPSVLMQNASSFFKIECDDFIIHKTMSINCPAQFAVKNFSMAFATAAQKVLQSVLPVGSIKFEKTKMTLTGTDPGAVTLFDFTGSGEAELAFIDFEFTESICTNPAVKFTNPTAQIDSGYYVWFQDVDIVMYGGKLFVAAEDSVFILYGRNSFNIPFDKGAFAVSIFGDGELINTTTGEFYHPIVNQASKILGTDANGFIQCLDIDVDAVPRWKKFSFSYAMFNLFNVPTYAATLTSLLAGEVLHAVKIKHSTAFTGGSVSALTVEVGIATDYDKYATAFNILQPVADNTFQLSSAFYSENHNAPTTLYAMFRATGGNVGDITQGFVDIWLLVSKAV